jgi:hypothetical protein
MIQQLPENLDDLIAVRVSGTLTSADVAAFENLLEPVMQRYGSVRLYFEMVDFQGWEPAGFVQHGLFDLTHGRQYGNVAMVGEKKWQDWVATLVDPVKKGKVRYFDLSQREEALQWLTSPGEDAGVAAGQK